MQKAPKDWYGKYKKNDPKVFFFLCLVFFPNLANTVAEVGKAKPYGSRWGGGSTRPSKPCRSPYASAGAAAASGRALPLYPPGAELPPTADSGPPLSISGPPGRPRSAGPGVCRPQRRAASTPFPGVARSGFLQPSGHKQPARPAGTCSRRIPLAGFYRAPGSREQGIWKAPRSGTGRPVHGPGGGSGERSAKPRGERWRKVLRIGHLAVLGKRRPPVGRCAKLQPGLEGDRRGRRSFFFFFSLTKIIFNIGI